MKLKYIVIVFLVTTLFYGCRIQLVNAALNSVGVFDDQVEISKFECNEKNIVFIPMHHAGTKKFYDDVTEKVDSLEQKGYYIYWEKIKPEKADSLTKDTLTRKFRKATGVFYFKNDFAGAIDSLTKNKSHKLKKPLVNQPSYCDLGVDSLNSRNVDATITQMVSYYDNKYGKLILEPCDFETKITEINSCKKMPNHREISKDLIVHYRNNLILNELDRETKTNIAIIYGEEHLAGIKEGLLERGCIQVKPPQ